MSFLKSKNKKGKGSKSSGSSKPGNSTVISSNGRVVNPFQDNTKQQQKQQQQKQQQQKQQQQQQQQQQPPQPLAPVSVPHSNSDLNSRKMIVLQEYKPPADDRGLAVRRGESVQVISQDQGWSLVRNERGKEGYVPSSHLVAPYSTMRTRTRTLGSGVNPPPFRQVASGSSLDFKEQHNPNVPMHHSMSAGKPWTSQDDYRVNVRTQRGYSPQDLSNNNNNSLSQGGFIGGGGGGVGGGVSSNSTTMMSYDQKYSPSTSSGVASFTGTASPVGHSDGSNHSSFCSIEDDNRGGVAWGSEEVTPAHNEEVHETGDPSVPPRPHTQHHGNSEENSDSNVYNYIPGENDGNEGDVPPPLPPRSFYYNLPTKQTAQQPVAGWVDENTCPVPPNDGGYDCEEFNPYAAPADAIDRVHGPHLMGGGHVPTPPRARAHHPGSGGGGGGEGRFREIRLAQETGVYTEVFQGHQRPHHHRDHHRHGHTHHHNHRHNGYRVPPYHEEETSQHNSSEGGSSRSRSSRQSGSRVSSLRTQTTEPYCDSWEMISGQESDLTPNGNNRWNSHVNRQNALNSKNSSMTKIKKFRRNLWGVYMVMRDFDSCDENEVSVKEGDHVSVWNQDDSSWYWIVKHDTSEEGFVPSGILKEIVNPDSHQPTPEPPVQPVPPSSDTKPQGGETSASSSKAPPPLPPKASKQQYPPPPPPPPGSNAPRQGGRHFPYDNHVPFRVRATSHDTRPSPLPPRGGAPTSGRGSAGFRGRLGSDGSIQSSGHRGGHSSTTSIERTERSISPPNSPPPPYSEFDSNSQPNTSSTGSTTAGGGGSVGGGRHFSLSQHTDAGSSSHYNTTTHMQRTMSHGQVPYRRVNIPRPLASPMLNSGGGVVGTSGEHLMSPGEVFILKSPTATMDGGTLV